MKSRHIKKLRIKIIKKGYYKKRLDELLSKEKDLNHFFHFECNEFFVGYHNCKVNLAKYNKNIDRLSAKIEFYINKLGVW